LSRVVELGWEAAVLCQARRVRLHDDIGGGRLQGDRAGTSADTLSARVEVLDRIPLEVRVVFCGYCSRAAHGLLLGHRDALLRVEREWVEVRYGSGRRVRGNVLLATLALWQHERAGTHGRRKVRINRLFFS
jgi:hypothetical protein